MSPRCRKELLALKPDRVMMRQNLVMATSTAARMLGDSPELEIATTRSLRSACMDNGNEKVEA